MTSTVPVSGSAAEGLDHGRDRTPGAGLLAGLLLLRFAAIGVGVAAGAGMFRLFGDGAAAWVSAVVWSAIPVVVVADVATVVVLVRVLRREGRRLRDLLGPRDGIGTAWRSVVAFVVLYVAFGIGATAGGLLTGSAVPTGGAGHVPMWFALWNLLVLPVTVAVAEEFLYRGYLQPRLQARIGTPGAVVTVAAAFALQHVGLAAYSVDAIVAKLCATFVAGLALGLLYLWFRRLAPLIVAHWLLDVLGIGVPMLMLALRG